MEVDDKVELLPVDKDTKVKIKLNGDLCTVISEPRPMHCFYGATGVLVRADITGKIFNVKTTDVRPYDINSF